MFNAFLAQVAQQFREDFGKSKALELILQSLLTADGCSDEEAMEVRVSSVTFRNSNGADRDAV